MSHATYCSTTSYNIDSPQALSSPKGPHQPRPKPNPNLSPKRLTYIKVKCRSVIEKKLELRHLKDQTKLDTIAGTETWLKDTHFNNKILDTDTYSVFRKDRKTQKGRRVFLVI